MTLLLAILCAAPLCVLPCKDTVEELWFKQKGMDRKTNLLVTIGTVTISFLLAILIKNIGDAITLAGCTTNPVVRTSLFI